MLNDGVKKTFLNGNIGNCDLAKPESNNKIASEAGAKSFGKGVGSEFIGQKGKTGKVGRTNETGRGGGPGTCGGPCNSGTMNGSGRGGPCCGTWYS